LDTYHNGYNATKGGDGSTLYNHNKIIELYKESGNMKQVAKIVNCSVDTIRNVLNTNNIDKEKRKSLGKSKAVEQYSIDGILLNTFSSCRAAAKYIAEL
jgi:2,3-bisphosphoglycerate-independent phosphoglycerate mutase